MINIILTQQAEHMGDHAQDITEAIELIPDETVEALCQRVLTKKTWARGTTYEQKPQSWWYLTIRVTEKVEPDVSL